MRKHPWVARRKAGCPLFLRCGAGLRPSLPSLPSGEGGAGGDDPLRRGFASLRACGAQRGGRSRRSTLDRYSKRTQDIPCPHEQNIYYFVQLQVCIKEGPLRPPPATVRLRPAMRLRPGGPIAATRPPSGPPGLGLVTPPPPTKYPFCSRGHLGCLCSVPVNLLPYECPRLRPPRRAAIFLPIISR